MLKVDLYEDVMMVVVDDLYVVVVVDEYDVLMYKMCLIKNVMIKLSLLWF